MHLNNNHIERAIALRQNSDVGSYIIGPKDSSATIERELDLLSKLSLVAVNANDEELRQLHRRISVQRNANSASLNAPSPSPSSSASSEGEDDDEEDKNDEQEENLDLINDDVSRIVGSKFARQLSKSHSVVQIDDSADSIYVGSNNRKTSQQGATHANRDEPYHCEAFCLIDGSPTVRETVLRYCEQSEPLHFDEVYSDEQLTQCRKVGEGVYSEVFMYKNLVTGKAIVLKVIPIEGSKIINGEPQKKFDEILPEIIISKELSNLRLESRNSTKGFVSVESVRCVRGRYPEHLIDLWELYRDNHGTDNDHPEVFDDGQLFIVLELENAGQDLEAFNFTNATQAYSAFVQVVLTLAVAESTYEFEHRDLHWGNILLRQTDEKEAHFVLDGHRYSVPTEGIQVTIIDYTLSRMLYKRRFLQFNDLATDEDLFSATGDYQFEIYRLMRKRLSNCWSAFEPYTNVLWLHYAIDKMINGARYRLKQSKKHRNAIKQLMKLRDDVLDYKSATGLAELFKQRI